VTNRRFLETFYDPDRTIPQSAPSANGMLTDPLARIVEREPSPPFTT
jgi:hypothetical protein